MVQLIFRKKREGVNSIETVFNNIDGNLSPHQKLFLPQDGANLKNIFANICFARKHRAEVNHVTGDTQYIAIGTGRRTVLTIHDIGSALQGNWLKKQIIKALWFWVPALIVERITVISEETRKELIKIVPFAKKKIVVIHNAICGDINFNEKDFNAKCPEILHMGTKENKNLERVIEALQGIPCHLNIVGKLTITQKKLLAKSSTSYENHFDVEYQGIIRYYQKCDIVSFPSTYEGFGVPILEANATGRPIVVGNIPVLHEVANDAACFVNPHSVESIRNGFLRICRDKKYRETLVLKGRENIKRFSSETIAAQYNSIYNEIEKK